MKFSSKAEEFQRRLEAQPFYQKEVKRRRNAILISFFIKIAFWVLLIYVISHFIIKYW